MSELTELDGVRLVYEDRGEGFPILLLHGIPTQRYLWRGIIPILTREGFRAIAPDLAGFGGSEAPPEAEIHVANQAAWMVAFLDRLSIDWAVVVGHDIRGGVAQIMAVRYPDRVSGLVLINSAFDESWPVEAMKRMAGWDPSAAAKLHDLLVERLPAQATVQLTRREGSTDSRHQRSGMCSSWCD